MSQLTQAIDIDDDSCRGRNTNARRENTALQWAPRHYGRSSRLQQRASKAEGDQTSPLLSGETHVELRAWTSCPGAHTARVPPANQTGPCKRMPQNRPQRWVSSSRRNEGARIANQLARNQTNTSSGAAAAICVKGSPGHRTSSDSRSAAGPESDAEANEQLRSQTPPTLNTEQSMEKRVE